MIAKRILKKAVDYAADHLIPEKYIGSCISYIHHRRRGENMDDPRSNGEYCLLKKVLACQASAGGEFFDVGANHGDWTRFLVEHGVVDGNIRAFEPVRGTYEKLVQNVAALKVRNVYTYNSGLGDVSGEAEILVEAPGAGSNSLYKRSGTTVLQANSEKVSIDRGERFCASNGIARVGFLKIDTEGHELKVIEGFRGLLEKRKIDLIQFEYGGSWVDSKSFLKDAYGLLRGEFGYCLGKIYPHGVVFKDKYDQRDENFAYANWAAVSPEKRFVVDSVI